MGTTAASPANPSKCLSGTGSCKRLRPGHSRLMGRTHGLQTPLSVLRGDRSGAPTRANTSRRRGVHMP